MWSLFCLPSLYQPCCCRNFSCSLLICCKKCHHSLDETQTVSLLCSMLEGSLRLSCFLTFGSAPPLCSLCLVLFDSESLHAFLALDLRCAPVSSATPLRPQCNLWASFGWDDSLNLFAFQISSGLLCSHLRLNILESHGLIPAVLCFLLSYVAIIFFAAKFNVERSPSVEFLGLFCQGSNSSFFF